jgi:hypothetical protein
MRSFIALVILLLLIACKGKKIKPAENKPELPQSTVSEIPESREAPRSDTLALIKAFKKFRLALNNEDGFLLSSMSAGNNYFPPSLTGMLQLPPGFPDFLISRPIKKFYKPDIWNTIQTIEPKVYARTGQYEVSYLVKKISKKAITEMRYSFEFIKETGRFKFLRFETEDESWQALKPDSKNITWYFPPNNYTGKTKDDSLHLGEYTNIWYSLILKNCEEPVLYNYKGSEEIYRFTWLRSFNFPVVFRFQKQGFNFILTTKVLRERYDEYPDELETNDAVSVSFFKWYRFKGKLAEADFWKLDLNDKTARPNDGSVWIVEGVKDGKYHMVERWAPGPDLHKACLYLLSISNLKIRKEDIY